jgi:hypothetical protein
MKMKVAQLFILTRAETAPPSRIVEAEYVSCFTPSTEQEEENSIEGDLDYNGVIEVPPEVCSAGQRSESSSDTFGICGTNESTNNDAYDDFISYLGRIQHSLPLFSFQKVVKVEDTCNSSPSIKEDVSPMEDCPEFDKSETSPSQREDNFNTTISIHESMSSLDEIDCSSYDTQKATSRSSNPTSRTFDSNAEVITDLSPSMEQDEKRSIDTNVEDDGLAIGLKEYGSQAEVPTGSTNERQANSNGNSSSHKDIIVSSADEIVDSSYGTEQDTPNARLHPDFIPLNPTVPLFNQRNAKAEETAELSSSPKHYEKHSNDTADEDKGSVVDPDEYDSDKNISYHIANELYSRTHQDNVSIPIEDCNTKDSSVVNHQEPSSPTLHLCNRKRAMVFAIILTAVIVPLVLVNLNEETKITRQLQRHVLKRDVRFDELDDTDSRVLALDWILKDGMKLQSSDPNLGQR